MDISCVCDEPFYDYRERIAVSNGEVRCCETGILIPAGFPYALCEGSFDGDWRDEQEWERHPQAIEVWRLLRNTKKRHNACFCFMGVEEELFWNDGDGVELFKVRWIALKKRITQRYAEGKQPRLWPHEKANLNLGEYVDALPYSTREMTAA